MRKVIIGVDIDGTVGDYVDILRQYLTKKFNTPENKISSTFPEPTDYAFRNWGENVAQNFKQLHSEAVTDGIYQNMEPFPQASEHLWELNNEDYHLRVITSRFVKHGQNYEVVSSTSKWLDMHNMPYRDLMFVHEKTEVYVDVLIDDSPYNIEACQKTGRNIIIFDAPYNRHFEGTRVHNWEEAYNEIKKLYPTGFIEETVNTAW